MSAATLLLGSVACSSTPDAPASGTGGASATTGGTSATGGVNTGGISTGGVSTGGISTGGINTGGALVSTGGTTGGSAPTSTGGTSTGGTNSGGSSASGAGTGGALGGAGTGGGPGGTSSGGGGGNGKGGAASGGTSAGGAGGGAGSGDCKSFKLCDGFEEDAPGAGNSPWKVTQGSGYTVMVDTTQAHSGTKSVHISAPTAAGSGVLKETKTFPATDFWGRAFLRFKTASGGHQMFIAVITQGDQFRLFNTLGSDKIQLNEQSGDKFFASATTVPMEKWFCYEWHVTPNSASVYVDGKQLTDATPTGWNIMNAQSLQIGYQRFQAGPSAGEIWIDDVAIHTAQIGCQ
jgi:hypothetical protein